jgi:hypothetical protein
MRLTSRFALRFEALAATAAFTVLSVTLLGSGVGVSPVRAADEAPGDAVEKFIAEVKNNHPEIEIVEELIRLFKASKKKAEGPVTPDGAPAVEKSVSEKVEELVRGLGRKPTAEELGKLLAQLDTLKKEREKAAAVAFSAELKKIAKALDEAQGKNEAGKGLKAAHEALQKHLDAVQEQQLRSGVLGPMLTPVQARTIAAVLPGTRSLAELERQKRVLQTRLKRHQVASQKVRDELYRLHEAVLTARREVEAKADAEALAQKTQSLATTPKQATQRAAELKRAETSLEKAKANFEAAVKALKVHVNTAGAQFVNEAQDQALLKTLDEQIAIMTRLEAVSSTNP